MMGWWYNTWPTGQERVGSIIVVTVFTSSSWLEKKRNDKELTYFCIEQGGPGGNGGLEYQGEGCALATTAEDGEGKG
jgi:hypothetical protein